MGPSAGWTWGLVTVLQRPGGVPARLMGLGQRGRVPCRWTAGATSTFWARGPGRGRSAWQGGTGPGCGREVAASSAQQVGGPACPSAPLGSPPLAPHEEAVGSVCHGSRPWPHGSCFLRPGRPAPGGRWWQRWPTLGRLVWGAWSCSRPASASFWLGDLVPLRL